jgi:hypothetical protein
MAPDSDYNHLLDTAAAAGARARRLLLAAAGIALLATGLRLVKVLSSGSNLDQAAGVWTALATDAAGGVFYRPIESAIGFGGTRYFPLHFLLQAGLIRLGLDPLVAGHTLELGSGVLLIAGAYRLMRRLGVAAALAGPAAVFTMITAAGQFALGSIRGDLLPVAIVVWALAVVVREPSEENPSPPPSPGLTGRGRSGIHGFSASIFISALLFVLAFAAKPTSALAAGAVAVWLLVSHRQEKARARSGVSDDVGSAPRTDSLGAGETVRDADPTTTARRGGAALGFIAVFTLGAAAVVMLTQLASDGRFLAGFLACAGGSGWAALATAPAALLNLALNNDPASMFFVLLALAAMLCGATSLREIPALWFLSAGVGTVIILAAPGTSLNHLLDVQVAAVVLIVVQIARRRVPFSFGVTALACAGFIAAVGTGEALRQWDNRPFRQTFATAVERARPLGGTVLFEHPLEAVIAGQRPFMLDPFSFALQRQRDPGLGNDLFAKLDARFFSAVVLMRDPAADRNRMWYEQEYFGPGFTQRLLADYQLLDERGAADADREQWVFVPRGDSAGPDKGEARNGAVRVREDRSIHEDESADTGR